MRVAPLLLLFFYGSSRLNSHTVSLTFSRTLDQQEVVPSISKKNKKNKKIKKHNR